MQKPSALSLQSCIPSVSDLLQDLTLQVSKEQVSKNLLVQIIRQEVAEFKETEMKLILKEPIKNKISNEKLRNELRKELTKRCKKKIDLFLFSGIRQVINATGVVLHTNLGRAPFESELFRSMERELTGYCSLEWDMETLERGNRTEHWEKMAKFFWGVDGACIVNNNAAAMVLILNTFAQGRQVVISRSELVQIGGGFKIPEILEASGAILTEVGTTNITTIQDYARVVEKKNSNVALILVVHPSNFFIGGHTKSPSLKDLGNFARKKKIPFIYDLGSESFYSIPNTRLSILEGVDTEKEREKTVLQIIKAGVDLVCFSGDKLFGGPQSGIILGKSSFIEKIKKSPLYRAFRLGKLDLFCIEEIIKGYLQGKNSLTQRLLQMPLTVIEERTTVFATKLSNAGIKAKIRPGYSPVGGGSRPEIMVSSFLIQISPPSAFSSENFFTWLAQQRPAIIVRKEKGCAIIDLRTVLPEQEYFLEKTLHHAFSLGR